MENEKKESLMDEELLRLESLEKIDSLEIRLSDNRKKIERMLREQSEMEKEILQLRKNLAYEAPARSKDRSVAGETTVYYYEPEKKTGTYTAEPRNADNHVKVSKDGERYAPGQSSRGSYESVSPKKAENQDAESVFGRRIMPVAASLLIFISIILFGTQLAEKFDDEIKLLMMFVGSGIFTAFGLVFLRKNKDSAFNIALTGVGIGGFYISLFMGNAYFGLISELCLFLCLLLWAAAVLVLSFYISRAFHIIGNLGIMISTVFGTALCIDTLDGKKFLFLIVYFAVGSIAYILFSLKKKLVFIISAVFNVISALVLLYGGTVFNIEGRISSLPKVYKGGLAHTGMIILCIYMFLMTAAVIMLIGEETISSYPVAGAMYSVCLAGSLLVIFYENEYKNLFELLAVALIFISAEFKYSLLSEPLSSKNKRSIAPRIWQLTLLSAAVLAILNDSSLSDHAALLFILLPLILWTYLREDTFLRYASAVLALIFMINDTKSDLLSFAGMAAAAALALVLMKYFAETYSTGFKCFWTVYVILAVFLRLQNWLCTMISDRDFVNALCFTICAVILGLAAKTDYAADWLDKEEEPQFNTFIDMLNAAMMLLGLFLISETDEAFSHFTVIAVTLALFLLNARKQISGKKSSLWQIYAGIKFTVLLITILSSFNEAGSIMSICLFILAVLCIVCGFMMKAKYLRIYGLVLSMICVFKLVMADLSHENTMGHAISFFVSGLLCLAISAIYGYIEKRNGKD